jgi:hypothetical protein
VVVRDAEAAELPVLRQAETGLDRWPRVCMRRDIPG